MRNHGLNRGPIVVVSFTGNSGLTDYSVSFCREAAKENDVVLLTAESIDPFYRAMDFPLETIFRRSRHYPVDLVRFIRRIRKLRPSVVVFQGPLKFAIADGLAVRYLRKRGIRVAVVVHDVVPHNQRALSAAALHFYYRAFPQLVVHSEAAVGGLRAAGIRGDTLTVPHGRYDIFEVDNLTREEARAALAIDREQRVALFFGNLEERKGLGPFMAAAELDRGRTTLFLAAGQDFLTSQAPKELRDALRGHRTVPGLRLDVGRVSHRDVQKYFRASDVVVLPYLEGSTSGVLKLALAFGVPVLATDVGDIREQLVGKGGRILDEDVTPRAILDGLASLDCEARRADIDAALEWRTIAPRVIAFLLDDKLLPI